MCDFHYGLYNIREERELASSSMEYIAKDIHDIKHTYIRLGFHLYEMKRLKYYEDFGFEDFYECIDTNFGMDKSMTSRCINVYFRFGYYNPGAVIPTMFINERYSDYSYSQLCEMLSLNDKDIKLISPDMTIKQIRQFKKKGVLPQNTNMSFVATSQQNCLVEDDIVSLQVNDLSSKVVEVASKSNKEIVIFDSNGKLLLRCNADIIFDGKDMNVVRLRNEVNYNGNI